MSSSSLSSAGSTPSACGTASYPDPALDAAASVGQLSSLRPMMTLPATSIEAPSHQRGGSDSEKMTKPSNAVKTKLEEVFMMDTWVVEFPLASAWVKSVHICHDTEMSAACWSMPSVISHALEL
ncbi:hypothetical protein ACKVWC_011550 [Pyricularia oryzae]